MPPYHFYHFTQIISFLSLSFYLFFQMFNLKANILPTEDILSIYFLESFSSKIFDKILREKESYMVKVGKLFFFFFFYRNLFLSIFYKKKFCLKMIQGNKSKYRVKKKVYQF